METALFKKYLLKHPYILLKTSIQEYKLGTYKCLLLIKWHSLNFKDLHQVHVWFQQYSSSLESRCRKQENSPK